MAIVVWGLDDGFGDLKAFNGRDNLLIPSYVTRWIGQEKVVLGDMGTPDPYSHITIEYDGKKYLIGEGAVRQDPKIRLVGGQNKHKDLLFPALLKTCMAMMSEDHDKVTVDPLVLGLPVKDDQEESRHETLTRIAKGKHNVKLTLGDGSVFEKEINVKSVFIVKQPFGSFCEVILDDNGEIRDPKVASQYNVVIDIGARTLNILTLDRFEIVSPLTTHTNQGMMQAYEYVGNYLNESLKVKFAEGKLPHIVKEGYIGEHNLEQIREEAYEYHANTIFNKLDTMFVDSWDEVHNIIFTGGGSEVLKSWLDDSFADKKKNIIFLDRYSTARGLRKYGVRKAKENGKKVERTAGGGLKITEVAATKGE